MAAADRERLDLVRRQVVGILFAPDARGRLDRRAYHDLVAVGDPAVDAARVVGRSGAFDVEQRVVVLRTAQTRPGEAAAEFDPLDGRDGEQQVGDQAFGRIEEGLSQSQRDALYAAFDDSADRIQVGRRRAQYLVEARGVGASADLGEARVEGDARREHLLGDDARGDERHGQACREMAAAPRVVEPVEAVVGHQVGVRRPVVAGYGGVILRMGVGVGEFDGERRPRRHAVVKPRYDLRDVRLAARRGAAGTAAAACEVGFEIFRRERNTCGNPVDRDADLRPVRLPPDGEPEIVSENIHGVQILIFSRSSKNPG